MKVLITGSAGWIGSAAWAALEAKGHECYGFDLVAPPGRDRQIVGDLLDPTSVRAALREVRPDAVLHLAAVRDPGAAHDLPTLAWTVNVAGTSCLLEAMVEIVPECFVAYASTVWVLGWTSAEAPMREWQRPAPCGHPYAASKLAGEDVVRSYAMTYEVRAAIMRFGIPYGPGQEDSSVVPAFVKRIAAGEPVRMTGDGDQTRPFMWLGDLVDGIVRTVESAPAFMPGHHVTFHLTRTEEVTIARLAEVVAEKLGRELKVERVEARAADMAGAKPGNAFTKEALEWDPSTGIVEGVDRYVEWWFDTGVEGLGRGGRGLDR